MKGAGRGENSLGSFVTSLGSFSIKGCLEARGPWDGFPMKAIQAKGSLQKTHLEAFVSRRHASSSMALSRSCLMQRLPQNSNTYISAKNAHEVFELLGLGRLPVLGLLFQHCHDLLETGRFGQCNWHDWLGTRSLQLNCVNSFHRKVASACSRG